MEIKTVSAMQVFDSRGDPTVECTVVLADGSEGSAIVPSGASTGRKEALELRDGDAAFGGKGVSKAIANIFQKIAPAVAGKNADDQHLIDKQLLQLDGTDNKSGLGANATLAVSLAVAHAAAHCKREPLYAHIGELTGNTEFTLPMPQLNILNGGKHADGSTDIQEFMIIPVGAKDFPEALRMASEIYHALRQILQSKGYPTNVGDEGGYAPGLHGGTEEALDLLLTGTEIAGYRPGTDIVFALDVAASELYANGRYNFSHEGKSYTAGELIAKYEALSNSYPIISIEDGLADDDWVNWQKLYERLGNRIQLVGDDLFATNTKFIKRGIDEHVANTVLIKPNQIGTLSETFDAVKMAKQAGCNTIISHRSGDTEDVSIAHLAVGLNAGQIKTGSFSRSERVAKYNELLRIANQLQDAPLSNPFAR